MDVLLLSRLQFTATTIFHFFFVPLTLGLSVLVAIMETQYARTGNETYLKMTRFWGKLFLINFAVGVVTGITLEFQFGTNWSGYSAYVGDIFGSLLAIEATAAFFLESTLIGVWVFGWKKLSRKAHAVVMWLVAGASNLSAIWILTANGWMQQPVGYAIRNGRAELTDFAAVVFNTFSILQILHVVPAALLLAAFSLWASRLSPAQSTEHGLFHPLIPTRPGGGHDRLLLGHPRRRHARQACDQGPAREACRHGVTLGHHVPGAGLHVCRAG
jgi:cytochrome d ubiquinol oxidase subunit I